MMVAKTRTIVEVMDMATGEYYTFFKDDKKGLDSFFANVKNGRIVGEYEEAVKRNVGILSALFS